MPDYRIYGLNQAGGFTSVHEVRTASDDEAVAAGRSLIGSDAFEVWERARFVARPVSAAAEPASELAGPTHS